MKQNNVLEFTGREAISDPLTALLRSGAQQLINQTVEAELQELLSQYSDRRTEAGNAVVVRNGHLPERELQTGLGPATVRIPKVRSKTGEPVTFRSSMPQGLASNVHRSPVSLMSRDYSYSRMPIERLAEGCQGCLE